MLVFVFHAFCRVSPLSHSCIDLSQASQASQAQWNSVPSLHSNSRTETGAEETHVLIDSTDCFLRSSIEHERRWSQWQRDDKTTNLFKRITIRGERLRVDRAAFSWTMDSIMPMFWQQTNRRSLNEWIFIID